MMGYEGKFGLKWKNIGLSLIWKDQLMSPLWWIAILSARFWSYLGLSVTWPDLARVQAFALPSFLIFSAPTTWTLEVRSVASR